MKKILFSCCIAFLFMGQVTLAQRNEIGLGLGAMWYTGDLARYPQLANSMPGLTVYYRQNFNPYLSLRVSALIGGLKGSDTYPIDAFAEERAYAFNILITELSAIGEFNFLDIRNKHSLIKWTPYLMGGVGVMAMFGHAEATDNFSPVQPVIPFGLGLKFALSQQFTLDITYGFRKTFFDHLDNISSSGDFSVKDYQYGNRFDKDMYQFFGISLGYIFYKIPCPYDFY
ncbi:MAG: outer membrane beta-barrel protein [Cyclobacteriaceae bacterium]|nr:outer membrane beta-barrel protein [Cyclobacteriaceae bacterium]